VCTGTGKWTVLWDRELYLRDWTLCRKPVSTNVISVIHVGGVREYCEYFYVLHVSVLVIHLGDDACGPVMTTCWRHWLSWQRQAVSGVAAQRPSPAVLYASFSRNLAWRSGRNGNRPTQAARSLPMITFVADDVRPKLVSLWPLCLDIRPFPAGG